MTPKRLMKFCSSASVLILGLMALSGSLAPVSSTWAKTAPSTAAPAKPATPLAPVAAPTQVAPLEKPDFAHLHSDLTADPSVRFGKLSNGMGYAILKNATPPGTVSMRLRIGAGSLMESPEQQGLAHFIEHMIFRGSKNVGANEFVKILERHGLKFGPDTNAHTGFNETVYELDLPKNDADVVDTAMFLLRESASNVTFDAKAIDDERGVVLGEERARASPGLRNYMAWAKVAFAGQKYPERLPIGQVDVLKTAQRDRFVDFYNAFYRPELATLIIVGDINPDEIESKIKAKFGDWAPATPGAVRSVDFGAYKPKGARAFTYAEPGLSQSVGLTWAKPFDETYQTAAEVKKTQIRSLALSIINQRLERQAKDPNTSFASASISYEPTTRTADLVDFSITPKPGNSKAAFEEAYRTLRQFVAYGAQQNELDRELSETDTYFAAAAKGEKTRNTRSLADELSNSLDEKFVFSSPGQDLEFYAKLKPQLTLAAVNDAAAHLLDGDGPLISHSGSELYGLDEAALMQTYTALNQEKLTAAATITKKAWPYTEFGKPAKIIKTETVADFDLKQFTYANGVKLTLKPTKFEDNKIYITVRFDGGRRAYGADSHPPITAANFLGVFEGGLGKLTSEEIKETLAGKIYGTGFGVGDDASSLSGATTPQDFDTQMQVLMAFTTDAAERADAFDRIKAFVPDFYKRLNSSPDGVFNMYGSALLHDNDPRFTFPTEAELTGTPIEAVRNVILNPLKSAPVEITMVGDIDEAKALKIMDQTFATLAPRPGPKVAVKGATAHFPTKDLHRVLTHKGRADQNLSFVAWPIPDFYADPKRARGLEMLSEILTLRLTDEVRVKQGASYSPYAYSSPSLAFEGYGLLAATAGVKPEQDQGFYDTLTQIASDLKSKPITEDELTRARKPTIDKLLADRKTNGYWAGVLPGSITDPRRLTNIRTRIDQLNAITPAELQTLAQTYLDMSKAMRIQIKPEAPAATTPTTAPTTKPAGQ